jgi:hypothetical protein
MKMSKKPKRLTDADIYNELLRMIADVEGARMIDITETTTIPLALDRLKLGVKYRMFDLEATVRDCRILMEKLENNGET